MNEEFIEYYSRELTYLREEGAEFASEFEKIAGRLGLTEFINEYQVADPYVERLLEGFAFLAARLHLKLDAQFPVFTQNLLEIVYPNYLAPRPSMAVAQIEPDLTEGALVDGVTLPRHTRLVGNGPAGQTSCVYQTGHDVTLMPLRVVDASYVPNAGSLREQIGDQLHGALAAVRVRLEVTAGAKLRDLSPDSLSFYVTGGGEVPGTLLEQIIGNGLGCCVVADIDGTRHVRYLPKERVRRDGFDEDQALLPSSGRAFSGYRLLEEYFALPQRFQFINLGGLREAFGGWAADLVDVYFLVDRSNVGIDGRVSADNFLLHCTPAINLFSKRCDRIRLDPGARRYHLIPDRMRGLDFEVFGIESVTALGDRQDERREFLPMYGLLGAVSGREHQSYFSTAREQRMRSMRERRSGGRSSYVGSETYLTLSDAEESPYPPHLKELAVMALCTNRDLPIQMSSGAPEGDFTLEIGGPINRIRCVAGPSRPTASRALGDQAWRLLSYLSLNYLSLIGEGDGSADALKTLLLLHCDDNDRVARRQVDGIMQVRSRPITARVPGNGPVAFGRGIHVDLECEESAFEGASAFLLGAVLEQFLARYVSLNSFTRVSLRSTSRGEIMTWPVRPGVRSVA